MLIRTIQQILIAPSIECTYSKAMINKSNAILTGGAYQSARKVTQCECKGFQICFLPEQHCSMHPASPALFSPQSFLLREKRLGRRRRVGSDHGGTSRRKRRLLSSVLTSSFPIRKRFAGLWIGFGETDHQALIFSSTCLASAAPAWDTAPDGRAACRCTERPSPAARRTRNCPPGHTGRGRGRCC